MILCNTTIKNGQCGILIFLVGAFTSSQSWSKGRGEEGASTAHLQKIIDEASFVIPKKKATEITYYRKEQTYFYEISGRTGPLPAPTQAMGFFIQSGRFLLSGVRQAPDEVVVVDGDRPLKTLMVTGFQWCATADYYDGRLYLAGFAQGSRLLFKRYGHGGREVIMAFHKKTLIPDESILHSLFLDDRWLVWIPSQLSMQQFNADLQPVSSAAVAVPESLWSISNNLLDLLRTEKEPQAMKELCEQHRGQPLHATPVGMFYHADRLVLCYYASRLKGYNPQREGHPKIDVDTYTQLIVLSPTNFEILDVKEIPELYVYGLGSADGRAIAKRWLGGNQWRAELVAWD